VTDRNEFVDAHGRPSKTLSSEVYYKTSGIRRTRHTAVSYSLACMRANSGGIGRNNGKNRMILGKKGMNGLFCNKERAGRCPQGYFPILSTRKSNVKYRIRRLAGV